VFDFCEGGDPAEDLYFRKNDVLRVLEYTQGEHWWNAELNGRTGLIPATLVRRLKPDETVEAVAAVEKEEEVAEVKEEEATRDEGIMECPFMAKVVEVCQQLFLQAGLSDFFV